MNGLVLLFPPFLVVTYTFEIMAWYNLHVVMVILHFCVWYLVKLNSHLLLFKVSLYIFLSGLLPFTDSGNGTGSTSSSRPQSQIIPDPHGTPNSDSPALLQKPQEKPKETVEILPEKLNSVPEVNDIKMNDVNPVSDKEESSEIEVSHGSDDKPVDIKTVTNDTAEAIPADTGSNTIEAKASDKETSQDVTDGGIATDTIGDIVEDKVTEKEAWQDIDRTNTPPIVVTPELPQKKSTEKIDFKSDFDDIDNNDDVFTELPDLRRPSQIINPSSSPRPSALLNSPVGMSSPVNLSPRPGRRSSFVSTQLLFMHIFVYIYVQFNPIQNNIVL